MNILLVEDSINIIKGLKYSFDINEYNLEYKTNIEDTKQYLENNKVDLIILDVNLPDGSGFDLYENNIKSLNIPTIFLTALDDENDIVKGLELADDYITKPFSVRELMARIKANLRKSEVNSHPQGQEQDISNSEKIITIGKLTLDLEKFEAKVDGKTIDLTLREFEVLKFLALQQGQIVTRELLLEKVWGYEYYGDIRTVDVTVRRIRGKIEKDTANPDILVTKRGVGYYIKTT